MRDKPEQVIDHTNTLAFYNTWEDLHMCNFVFHSKGKVANSARFRKWKLLGLAVLSPSLCSITSKFDLVAIPDVLHALSTFQFTWDAPVVL